MSSDTTSPQMIPVPIQDFISGIVVPVNLYVKLNETKYLILTKAGQKTNSDQLKSYEGKTIEYLWIKREDYSHFTQNNITIAGVIVTNKTLSIGQKTQVLSQAAANVFLELDHLGMVFDTYSHAKQIVEATVSLVENHSDLNDLLLGLKDCSDDLLRHSLAVSYLSILMGTALGWENKQTLEKLTLGALLHDIGMKVLPPELSTKPISKMTYEETQLYETHPYKGMKILLSLGVIPDDVIAIVYEHHENAIGQGYPRKLRNIKIHPLAKVVGLADEFCNQVLANPNCLVAKTPREALMTIEHTMGQPHNKEAFRALQRVVDKNYSKAG